MSSAPYFKLYFSDLAGDTLHLSDAEIGSYVLLLGAMWNGGGSLPLDPTKLARIARVTPAKWARRWASLAPFFIIDSNAVTHKRLSSERKKASGISEVRSENGKAGAEAKRLKNNNVAEANADQSAQQMQQQKPSIPDTIAIREKGSNDPSLSAAKPARASGKRKAEEAIPNGFPDAPALADAEGWVRDAQVILDVQRHAKRFRNHAATKDRRERNWLAAWRAWIDIEIEKAPAAQASGLPAAEMRWSGPPSIWQAALDYFGSEATVRTYLGHATWQQVPFEAIIAATEYAADKLEGARLGVPIIRPKGRAA